ncbi:MAG: hypothetical protein ACREH4_09830, partial [Vitreimonas sp.]
MLERVRASIGAPPRRRVLDSERVKAPGRVKRHPALADLAKRQNILLREGDIVWGAVVQANRAMFAPGWFNYAGSMLYSRDEAITATPHILLSAVEEIYAAKGRRGLDGEMQAIADMLYDGRGAADDLRVPLYVTRDIQCYITNVIFDRSHLPRGKLDVKLMPILIDAR